MKIVLQHLTKKFPARGPVRGRKNREDVIAVNDFDFEIPDGKLIGLLGPSGCGKSTALNLICGLLKPTEGKIFFGEDDVTGLPPENRGVGMVFQNYALYPHLTVEKNIQFPLENLKGADKLSKEEMSKRVLEAAKLVQIDHLLERKPNELSGGQQQRVAIARTLAPEPAVLFMDEPLSNLDAKLRLEMRYELQRLHVETGSTFVYVTHDQMEAMTLATKICLINNGVLQQYDAPLDVYNRPANLFVADFVGNPSINFVEAKGKEQADGSFSFRILDDLEATFRPNEPIDMAAWFAKRDKDAADLEAQRIEMLKDKKAVEKSNKDEVFKYHIAKVDESDYAVEEEPEITNEDFVLAIRPEALKLSGDGAIASTIYGAMPTGMESTVKLRIGKYLLTGVIFGGVTFKLGEETGVDIAGTDILLFDRKSGKAITAGSLAVKG